MTWFPRVTGVAVIPLAAMPPDGRAPADGIGSDQTFARAVYTAYARRRPSPESEIDVAPSPVDKRRGWPRGRPADDNLTA